MAQDELYRLAISEDFMRVRLEWLGKERLPQHRALVLEDLQKAGIVAGIHKEAIDSFFDPKQKVNSLVIAEGTAPRPGIDGFWESFFDLTPKKLPEHLLDGSVDFHHVQAIREVREGQPLARRIPPIPGIAGRDCRGKALPAPTPKDPSWALGEGTCFETDHPDYVVASRCGVLQKSDGKLSVVAQVVVRGSVDFRTGDIDVSVPISISEDIKPGFFVRSKASITVGGCVQSSRVECGGDLKVAGGILGEPHPTIRVGGNLKAHYAQNARIEVRGDCAIDKVVKDSVLTCGGDLVIGDRLVASRVFAGEKMQLGTLGAAADHGTRVVLGLPPTARRQLFRVGAELWEIEAALHQNALEHAENRQTLALEERFEGARSAQKTFTGVSAGAAELRRSAAQEGALHARQLVLQSYAAQILESAAPQGASAELQIEKAAYARSEIWIGSRHWILADDFTGRRTIRQSTLQNAVIPILALGDAVFQKEMAAWASAADLWSMKAGGWETNLAARIEADRPHFVLFQGRGASERQIGAFAAAARDARNAKTFFLFFAESVSEESLKTIPQAANCLVIPGAWSAQERHGLESRMGIHAASVSQT